MNKVTKNIDRKKIFILCFFASAVIVYLFHCNEALDIGRYYETADRESMFDLFSIILLHLAQGIDFIYYIILNFVHSLGFPYDFATILFVGFYWFLTLLIIDNLYGLGNVPKKIWLITLCFAPCVWVLSISRTIAALCFLYAGVLLATNKKWLGAVVFFLLAFFTHVSSFLFIGILLIASVVKRIYAKTHFSANMLLAVLIVASFVLPSLIGMMVNIFGDILNTDYYSNYASRHVGNVFSTSSIGIGDKVPIAVCWLYSIIILVVSKSKNLCYWVLYISTIFLTMFIGSSLMMTNRIIMFMPPFFGACFVKAYIDNRKRRKMLKFMALSGIVIFFLAIYTYRPLFYIGPFE